MSDGPLGEGRTAALAVPVDGAVRRVDARDVAHWRGGAGPVDADDARDYVAAHPRPAATGRGGVASAQRLALLRRLAAGPATRDQLREALRTVGWIGSNDLDNRLRELRETERASGLARLPVRTDAETVALAEPLPAVEPADRQALASARALLAHTPDDMAGLAMAALDGLIPGLADDAPGTVAARPAVSLARRRLDEARADARPVRVRYRSVNAGLTRNLAVLPVRYAPTGTAVKVLCVPIDEHGNRVRGDIQLALDRVEGVDPLHAWADPQPHARTLQRERIRLVVTRELLDVMVERNLFDVTRHRTREVDHDVLEVVGDFPVALAWDVMEQLCAWAGVAQVHEPLWLVRAVVERLRAGLAVMETAEPFRTVKPEPGRRFPDLAAALRPEDPGGGDSAGRARRLAPRDGDRA